MKKYYFISIIIHLLLILSVTISQKKKTLKPKMYSDHGNGLKIDILEKPDGPGLSICDKFYGGVGIELENLVVTKIFKGYPGERFLKIGDEIYSLQSITGKIGEEVTITIRRDGRIFDKKIKREKICIDK